jgi:hypothetical protein
MFLELIPTTFCDQSINQSINNNNNNNNNDSNNQGERDTGGVHKPGEEGRS